jgi:hypothetical protein
MFQYPSFQHDTCFLIGWCRVVRFFKADALHEFLWGTHDIRPGVIIRRLMYLISELTVTVGVQYTAGRGCSGQDTVYRYR